MALNTRSLLDGRFAHFARPAVASAMWAVVRIYRVTPIDQFDQIPEWDPDNPDLSQRTPGAITTFTPIYEGRARVQPNQDWRARPANLQDEIAIIHNTRIQVPFDGNQLGDKSFPDIRVNDPVRVLSVFGNVDPNITQFIHIVTNLVPSSNSWVRTLACNTDMTKNAAALGA